MVVTPTFDVVDHELVGMAQAKAARTRATAACAWYWRWVPLPCIVAVPFFLRPRLTSGSPGYTRVSARPRIYASGSVGDADEPVAGPDPRLVGQGRPRRHERRAAATAAA